MRMAAIAAVLVTAVLTIWVPFKHAYPGEFCNHRPGEWAMSEGCLTLRGTPLGGALGLRP
jgi:hypothetical protein